MDSLSTYFLPTFVICTTLGLPLLSLTYVLLYLSTWQTYYEMAQTDAEFYLPYHPKVVIQLNLLKLDIIVSWLEYMPKIISFVYWRYCKFNSEQLPNIARFDIPFGTNNNKLDVYYPENRKENELSKIILFIYGGGWGSGSKFLYTTLANTLREQGYVVVAPDYRKYPEVKIDEMYKDIRESIYWTFEHAVEMKGDPDQIYVMGHSAGAHLTAQVILSDIIEQIRNKSTTLDLNKYLPRIKGLLLHAGVYEISSHLIHEAGRGVDKISAMARAMGSTEEGFKTNSPTRLIERNAGLFSNDFDEFALSIWPKIMFLHGHKDGTVNINQTIDMYRILDDVLPKKYRKNIDLVLNLHDILDHGDPVTALMLNVFSEPPKQKLILKNINDFIDMP